MIITRTTTETFEFDPDEERHRIVKSLSGEQQARQLTILDHFLAGRFDEMEVCYDALPYDDEEECPEQEYIGLWHPILFGGFNAYSLGSLQITSDKTEVKIC